MDNILVIGAHYDDAELGAGGTMAKWVKEGKKVYKMTLSDNVTNFEARKIHVNYDDSVAESHKACEVLGVEEILDIPIQKCTELQWDKKQMQAIESFILNNNIDTVLLHNIFDIQQDHVHAATISYVAGRYCKRILSYQSNKYILPMDYYPRMYVDITDTVQQKIDALNCYGSSHNRYSQLFDMTIKQNRVWGFQATMQNEEAFAEAFNVIKFLL